MYRCALPVDGQPHVFTMTGDPVFVDSIGDAEVEFWYEHDSSKGASDRAFQVFGTGHPLPDDAVYVGTCPRTPLGLVWHLYERTVA
jgi:hypothetical protein